jgi:hypothetical protein
MTNPHTPSPSPSPAPAETDAAATSSNPPDSQPNPVAKLASSEGRAGVRGTSDAVPSSPPAPQAKPASSQAGPCVWCNRPESEHGEPVPMLRDEKGRLGRMCPVAGVTSQYYTPWIMPALAPSPAAAAPEAVLQLAWAVNMTKYLFQGWSDRVVELANILTKRSPRPSNLCIEMIFESALAQQHAASLVQTAQSGAERTCIYCSCPIRAGLSQELPSGNFAHIECQREHVEALLLEVQDDPQFPSPAAAASKAREIDPLDILNEFTTWDHDKEVSPCPIMQGPWLKKLAALCERIADLENAKVSPAPNQGEAAAGVNGELLGVCKWLQRLIECELNNFGKHKVEAYHALEHATDLIESIANVPSAKPADSEGGASNA